MTAAHGKTTELEDVTGTPDAQTGELSPDELGEIDGGALGGFSARAFNPQPEPPQWSTPGSIARRRP